MPNQPTQNPNINLPGAEYLALLRDSPITVERRGASFTVSVNNTVPAGTNGQGNATVVLDPQFTAGKGVYIADARLTYRPVDNTGEIQITGTQLNFGTTPTNGFYSLGFPLLTLLSPTVESVAVSTQDFLLTAHDVTQLLTSSGQNGQLNPPVPLSLNGLIFVHNNDPTNTHSFAISIQCIWHILSAIHQ